MQSAASRLQQGADAEPAVLAGRQLAAVLLLLFVFALEQGISCAAAGSGSSRSEAPQPASTFFAANDKVRAVQAPLALCISKHNDSNLRMSRS